MNLASQDPGTFHRNLDTQIQQLEAKIRELHQSLQHTYATAPPSTIQQIQQMIIDCQNKIAALMKAKVFVSMCAERRVPHKDAVRILRGNRDSAQLFNQLLHIPQSALNPLLASSQLTQQERMSGYPQYQFQQPRLPAPMPPHCFVCNNPSHGYATCPVYNNAHGAQREALQRLINEKLAELNRRPKFPNKKPPPPM
jgi:5-deoxy-D-glucuronate isomerase